MGFSKISADADFGGGVWHILPSGEHREWSPLVSKQTSLFQFQWEFQEFSHTHTNWKNFRHFIVFVNCKFSNRSTGRSLFAVFLLYEILLFVIPTLITQNSRIKHIVCVLNRRYIYVKRSTTHSDDRQMILFWGVQPSYMYAYWKNESTSVAFCLM